MATFVGGERTYLFNPWQMEKWTEEEICSQVNELQKEYNPEADTMYQIAHNIDVMSDINCLYGEMIARLTREYNSLKLENNSREAKMVYQLRKNWAKDNSDKAPAISYFEAQAYDMVAQDREKELRRQELLTRFKFAYDSLESKMNALKKKLESVKYETFNA